MTFDLAEVSFIQKGTGRDLVFFHGYLSSKESFTAQIEYFSRFYRVTAFDFLGFGQSAPLKEAFSVSDYAEWTKALLDALKIEPARRRPFLRLPRGGEDGERGRAGI